MMFLFFLAANVSMQSSHHLSYCYFPYYLSPIIDTMAYILSCATPHTMTTTCTMAVIIYLLQSRLYIAAYSCLMQSKSAHEQCEFSFYAESTASKLIVCCLGLMSLSGGIGAHNYCEGQTLTKLIVWL